jgi:hypothetical protein
LLHGQRRYEEAIPFQGEFLAGWSHIYGDGQAFLAPIAVDLVDSLSRVDDYGPHEAAIRSLLAFHERTLPPAADPISYDLLRLGQALVELGRHEEARQVLETTRGRFAKGRTPLAANWAYAATLTGLGQYEQAEENLILAWEASVSSFARDRRPIALRMAELYESQNRMEEAAVWREEAAALVE